MAIWSVAKFVTAFLIIAVCCVFILGLFTINTGGSAEEDHIEQLKGEKKNIEADKRERSDFMGVSDTYLDILDKKAEIRANHKEFRKLRSSVSTTSEFFKLRRFKVLIDEGNRLDKELKQLYKKRG